MHHRLMVLDTATSDPKAPSTAEGVSWNSAPEPVDLLTVGWRQKVRLIVRPRRPVASVVLAFAVFESIENSTSGADIDDMIPGTLHAWFIGNLVGAAVVTVLVFGFAALTWPRRGPQPTGLLAAVLCYGTYVVSGVVAGAVRILVEEGIEGHAFVPLELSAAVLFGAIFYTLVGLVANAYRSLIEALRARDRTLTEHIDGLRIARELLARSDEDLRRSLGELLHGRVQSRLVAVEHTLTEQASSLPESNRKALIDAAWVVERVRVDDIRATSHLLHPTVVRVGLGAALRSLAVEEESRLGIAVSIEIEPAAARLDDPGDNHIPEPVRLVVYRVVEEGLRNAVKHGAAGSAHVRISIDGSELVVTVIDDGRGLTARHGSPGMGLAVLDARVASRKGSWKLQPAGIGGAGIGGAELMARFPLRRTDLGLDASSTGPARSSTVERRAPGD